MHTMIFIQDLAIIMLIAGVITVLCHRFKQPVVLGYIIAGIIIGPHTPPFSYIQNEETIKTLGDLGVILLMFSLGLEFNFRKLSKIGFTAFAVSLAEIIVMMWIGYEVALLFKWSSINALFLGAMISISSTTIIVKALQELGMKREKFAQLIFGILIIEDIFAIGILALLSSVAVSGSLGFKDVIVAFGKLSSFLVISMTVGVLLVPKLIAYIAKFKNNEMLLISVLGLCFGFCLLVLKLDYSLALSAFIMGAIIAESQELESIQNLIIPLRDMFSAIFFVSVGLLFDPKVLINYTLPVIIITIIVITGKILICSLGTLIEGRDGKTAIRVGIGLSQIGEFSFIIASLGITLNVTSDFLYPIAVAVSLITTFITPYLIKYSDTFSKYIAIIMPNKLLSISRLYKNWLQNIEFKHHYIKTNKIFRRCFYQVIINLFIVMAIFFVSDYIAATCWGTIITQVTGEHLEKTLIWGSALILSLPFLIAIYQKLEAFSIILAELSIKKHVNNHFIEKNRKIISEIIPVLSLIGIMVFISILSSNILPPFGFLVLVLVITLILMISLFPWFIKLHSKLQTSLSEAMKKIDGNEN